MTVGKPIAASLQASAGFSCVPLIPLELKLFATFTYRLQVFNPTIFRLAIRLANYYDTHVKSSTKGLAKAQDVERIAGLFCFNSRDLMDLCQLKIPPITSPLFQYQSGNFFLPPLQSMQLDDGLLNAGSKSKDDRKPLIMRKVVLGKA